MSSGVIPTSPEAPCPSSKFRLGSQRRRTWEPEQEYPRQRRKLGRRASSVVACLWGGDRGARRAHRRRSESFSERQTYKAVSWKSLDISVVMPDGKIRRVLGDDRMQVWDLVSPLAAELGLQEPRLYMAESGAPVNASAPATLLNGEPLMMQEGQTPWDERSASDVRLRIVEELLSSEKEYCHTLKTVSDLYEKPLRKLLSMEKEDYKSFFDWVEPICSLSKMLIIKLTMVMEEWETLETKVAPIFSKLLWNKYEEYQTLYIDITLPLLKEKETTDEDFVSLCQLRRGAAKYSLAGLLELPLERLVQYERYLSLLAEQTTPDHPDYNDICRTANKAAAMVKRADLGREESDLDRIQDLFPSDHLRLHDKDPLSPRKGLMRSKSSAASKIQRALPGKSKACNGDMPCSPSRPEALSFQKKHLWGDDNFRVFIMESPVNFTMGVQKQDRHLFLFNDLLLVAKPRSGGTYKLKEKIRMGEIWLSQCIGDVCESIKSPATSFVIGWPTTNVVVTFNSLKTKDLWQQKLIQLIEESKEKEGKSLTSIQIAYRKPETGEEICKTLKVDNRQTVQDSIKQVLQQIGGFSESSLKDFKLWVKTGKDEAPYPLIGHEYPFCIKMNFIRELLRRSELNLQHVNKFSTDLECRFTLRRNSYNSSIRSDPRVPKKRKKHRKPHPKINWPFRKPASKHDSVDSGNSSPPPHNLFGLPLWKICPDTVLPKPVMSMLVQLFLQGPYTVGIFRKSANARSCRELKEKLEADPESDISNISVIVLSSVFKEFLRSLPDCLLQSDLYKSWLQATSYEGEECVKRVISLLTQLPPANIKLLQYLLCMLWHISQHSSENKMSSMNLAVCIGPTLLNPGKFQSPVLQQEDVAEKVPKAVAFLIDNCALLFGDQILQLFGPFPERDVSRQDSGAEESDSLHSLHDHPGQYRRDDSSIDSLDRDFLDEIEPSPKMEGKKMSLTNLSRDSGLTNSDTQLYTAEEEVESEYSSADSRRGTSAALTKSVPHLDTAGIDCNTASYGKNAGISIDGSCYDVVRKRRQGMEAHRTKSLAASYNHREYGYDSSPHLPLQLSQSYSYSMQQDLMDRGYDSFVRNYHNPVRRRDMRGRSVVQRPVVSAVEPIEDFAEGTLRRSASEESLLQNYSNTSASKRLLNQRKRRAPSPPHQKGTVSAPCSSKKSDGNKNNLSREMSSCSIGRTVDRHAVWFATHSRRTDWKRSQSTSKIDEMDLSHDSSTLSLVSSEDSTPQVSRSSSRVQELSSKSHSDLYAMYYSPPRVNSVCSSTSDGSQQSRNSSVKSNCSHKSQNGTAKPSEPPSYLEAINRQTMLKNLQTSPLKQVTEEMRAEQTSLSAKARELYENSVRMYSQQIPSRLSADSSAEDETHRAVPASIDCTDGLLKTSVKGTQTSPKPGQDSSHIRLRHLPPVHVTDAQLHRVRNFHIRPRHTREIMPEELRREINWSVAELRDMFNNRTPQDSSRSPCSFTEKFLENREGLTNGRSPRRMSQQQHTRSRSLSSRSEEESFV